MNTLKTILSIAFTFTIIFVMGVLCGVRINQQMTVETMNHFKGVYVEGHQYFCAEERLDNGK